MKEKVTLSLTINRSLVRSVIVQRICHPYEKRGDIERKGTETIIGINEVSVERITGLEAYPPLIIRFRSASYGS
jgi:hypothetical protein